MSIAWASTRALRRLRLTWTRSLRLAVNWDGFPGVWHLRIIWPFVRSTCRCPKSLARLTLSHLPQIRFQWSAYSLSLPALNGALTLLTCAQASQARQEVAQLAYWQGRVRVPGSSLLLTRSWIAFVDIQGLAVNSAVPRQLQQFRLFRLPSLQQRVQVSSFGVRDCPSVADLRAFIISVCLDHVRGPFAVQLVGEAYGVRFIGIACRLDAPIDPLARRSSA